MFEGGGTIGERVLLGESVSATSARHVVRFMRFDTDDRQRLLELLETHPVVQHGGSIQLCERPRDREQRRGASRKCGRITRSRLFLEQPGPPTRVGP